ncbi:Major facilitator superfamily [Macrophomina phaseolina MS6]|uniref:Major facilitator superfamily n=1 Tax=Macrophomina phaseolina (strain MS6) TaxID=1126212 RepID=K2QNW9_MACPH|nr:Major facilitator superfamily [Macrophomina phaseolina MS6]
MTGLEARREESIELPQAGQHHGSPLNAEPEPVAPRTQIKLISAGFSFFVAGVNDSSLGALIPYLIRSYGINTAMVSVIYAITFSGWFFAAITNSHLCQYLDLGAMLALGAVLQILSHALRFWFPPFPLFAITFGMVSLGQAYQDAHSNNFVSSVEAAHRWLSAIHATYSGGTLLGPFVSTAIASAETPSRWNLFYTVPLVLGVANIILCIFAFWDTLRLKTTPSINSETIDESRNREALNHVKETLRTPSVWLLSLFYFFYLGASSTANGECVFASLTASSL